MFSNIKVDGKDIGGRPDRSFGDAWHSDFPYMTEPAGGSFFYAKEVSERGGDDNIDSKLEAARTALESLGSSVECHAPSEREVINL